MTLMEFLRVERQNLVHDWCEAVLKSYPQEAVGFLKGQSDRFANPVGHAIEQHTGALFDQVVGAFDQETVIRALDGIMRIRAVQEFTAAEAVAFLFALKKIVRQSVQKSPESETLLTQIPQLESRVDTLALMGFDVYMRCREKVYQIRVNDLTRKNFKLLERVAPKGRPAEEV